MIKTSTFQIQIVCPGCNNYHAVSGIVDSDACQNCGRMINVSNVLLDRMFVMMDREKYMNGFLSGSVEQMGSDAYRLTYSSMVPYCEECYAVLEITQLIRAIESGRPFTCPSCSHIMPVRGADADVKEFHSKAIGIINDSHGVDAGGRNTDKDSMLVFKCMTCGAGLELTSKTQRTTKCNYCDNEDYLPDSIWTKLHPNKEVQPLFLLLDIDENDLKGTIDYFLRVTALKVYSKHFTNFIREYFERPFISDAFLCWVKHLVSAKGDDKIGYNLKMPDIQKNFYDNLKLGLNSQPAQLKETVSEFSINLPDDLQQMLASDNSDTVREALAKNKNLSKDVIKKLQGDKNPAVAAEAKKHKTGFLKSLFG
jgi:DNA-directed RNA polymerase subunit RPC12/RpoP